VSSLSTLRSFRTLTGFYLPRLLGVYLLLLSQDIIPLHCTIAPSPWPYVILLSQAAFDNHRIQPRPLNIRRYLRASDFTAAIEKTLHGFGGRVLIILTGTRVYMRSGAHTRVPALPSSSSRVWRWGCWRHGGRSFGSSVAAAAWATRASREAARRTRTQNSVTLSARPQLSTRSATESPPRSELVRAPPECEKSCCTSRCALLY
jgi:hypothetical protein